MRRIVLALALCALPSIALAQRPPRPPHGVSAEFDRYSQTTVVYSNVLEDNGSMFSLNALQIRIQMYTAFRGVSLTPTPQAVMMQVRIYPSLQDGWKLLNGDRRVYLLLPDGRNVAYQGEYTNEITQHGLMETVTIPVAISDVVQLASGKKLEGRVGPREFKLDEGDIGKLRNFVEYVTGQPVPHS